MNEFTKGQLIELCQMVYRGVKPCAMISIKDRDIKTAKIICIKENCKFKTIDLLGERKTFWIYIRDEIPEIIDILPEKPKTKADHYLLGALFGYSNDAICDYLNTLEKSKIHREN